jgi:hypothetical protein
MARRLLVLLTAVLLVGTAVGAAPVLGHPEPGDTDGDGIFEGPNAKGAPFPDNCVLVRNTDQTDTDGDGAGDRCDADDDNDGIADRTGEGRGTEPLDNCRLAANPGQEDGDGDGVGDACNFDADLDGFQDGRDNCPGVPNPDQLDNDRDDRGDACDPDDDDDTIPDDQDNCPLIDNFDQTDLDGDGRGRLCDADGESAATVGVDPGGSDPLAGGLAPGDAGSGPAGAVPAVKDTVAPKLRVRLTRVQRAADLAGGMPVSVRCSESCALTAELRLDARTARRLRLRPRLARANGVLGGPGRPGSSCGRPRGTQRALFRRRTEEVRASVTIEVVDAAGNRARATRRLALRR